MALTSRRLQREEEEESVFITMTDLMISILFIVMLVLAYFATLLIEDAPNIRELQQQVATLQEENEDLRAEIVNLQAQLEIRIDQGDRLKALREDNSRLRQELASIQVENERLQRLIENLEQQIATLSDENMQLLAENADLKQELEKLLHQDKIISALREDNERLRLELAEVKLENRDLKQLIIALRERIKDLRAELEQLRQKLASDPLETALTGISEDRDLLLSRIEDRLVAAGIKVIVDEVSGIVRFGEDAIQFRSGSASPDRRTAETMQRIAEILFDELSCYTLGEFSTISDTCNPNNSIIEAVQIEGHTDSDGADIYNLKLSTRRATSTYEVLVTHRADLTEFLNANYLLENVQGVNAVGQEVLSVSGYGETRPINFGTTQDDKDANRRIDIRFIMTTPKNVEEVERLKSSIRDAVQRQDAQE